MPLDIKLENPFQFDLIKNSDVEKIVSYKQDKSGVQWFYVKNGGKINFDEYTNVACYAGLGKPSAKAIVLLTRPVFPDVKHLQTHKLWFDTLLSERAPWGLSKYIHQFMPNEYGPQAVGIPAGLPKRLAQNFMVACRLAWYDPRVMYTWRLFVDAGCDPVCAMVLCSWAQLRTDEEQFLHVWHNPHDHFLDSANHQFSTLKFLRGEPDDIGAPAFAQEHAIPHNYIWSSPSPDNEKVAGLVKGTLGTADAALSVTKNGWGGNDVDYRSPLKIVPLMIERIHQIRDGVKDPVRFTSQGDRV